MPLPETSTQTAPLPGNPAGGWQPRYLEPGFFGPYQTWDALFARIRPDALPGFLRLLRHIDDGWPTRRNNPTQYAQVAESVRIYFGNNQAPTTPATPPGAYVPEPPPDQGNLNERNRLVEEERGFLNQPETPVVPPPPPDIPPPTPYQPPPPGGNFTLPPVTFGFDAEGYLIESRLANGAYQRTRVTQARLDQLQRSGEITPFEQAQAGLHYEPSPDGFIKKGTAGEPQTTVPPVPPPAAQTQTTTTVPPPAAQAATPVRSNLPAFVPMPGQLRDPFAGRRYQTTMGQPFNQTVVPPPTDRFRRQPKPNIKTGYVPFPRGGARTTLMQ